MIKMLSFADLITMLNAMLGFLAIIFVFSSEFQLAASFILLGLLADGLDGMVARRFGNGVLGQHLETIADTISLSIAPLVLVYMIYNATIASSLLFHIVLLLSLLFSLVCSMIRLSSFFVMKHHTVFIGLPTSVSAIFLVLISLLEIELIVIIPFIILFSILMISPIRFPKNGVKIDIVAGLFIIIAILLNFFYTISAALVLVFGLMLYIIIGPLYLQRRKKDG